VRLGPSLARLEKEILPFQRCPRSSLPGARRVAAAAFPRAAPASRNWTRAGANTTRENEGEPRAPQARAVRSDPRSYLSLSSSVFQIECLWRGLIREILMRGSTLGAMWQPNCRSRPARRVVGDTRIVRFAFCSEFRSFGSSGASEGGASSRLADEGARVGGGGGGAASFGPGKDASVHERATRKEKRAPSITITL